MVDYTPDPIHEDIREAVRTMCKAFPDEYWMEHDTNHEFPWEFYDAVAKGGWLGLTVPEEYGGGGLGVTEAAIVEQEISASGAGMGGCSAVHIGIFGFEPIIHHGTEELKQRFLPRVVTGELHTSFAVTEPDAGTDTTNISTFAKKVDGGWRVTGKKVWDFEQISSFHYGPGLLSTAGGLIFAPEQQGMFTVLDAMPVDVT